MYIRMDTCQVFCTVAVKSYGSQPNPGSSPQTVARQYIFAPNVSTSDHQNNLVTTIYAKKKLMSFVISAMADQ